MKIKLNSSNTINIVDFSEEMFKLSFFLCSTIYKFNINLSNGEGSKKDTGNSYDTEIKLMMDDHLRFFDEASDFSFYKKGNNTKYKFINSWDSISRTMNLVFDLSKFY